MFIDINKIIYIVFIFIFVSCKNIDFDYSNAHDDDVLIYDRNIDVKSISPSYLRDISKHLVAPRNIHVIDSLLIVNERYVDKDIFKIFSLKKNAYLGGYGERGEGPSELSNIQGRIVQNNKHNNDLIIYDFGRKEVVSVSVHDIINRTINNENYYKHILPPDLIFTQRATRIEDNILGSGGTPNGMLFWIDTKTNEITYAPFFPVIKNKKTINHQNISELYRNEFVVNMDRRVVVVANKWLPQLVFYSLSGEILKSVRWIEFTVNALTEQSPHRNLYYSDIQYTDEYIYAVFFGKSEHELMEKAEMITRDDNDGVFTEVHKFDWDGNFLKRIILEGKSVPFISIDEVNNRILSIDEYSIEPRIIAYSLEGIN